MTMVLVSHLKAKRRTAATRAIHRVMPRTIHLCEVDKAKMDLIHLLQNSAIKNPKSSNLVCLAAIVNPH